MRIIMKTFAENLAETPIIAILRGITVPEVPGVCGVLAEAGIKLLEVPLNTPGALECIAVAADAADGQTVGAGTVLTPEAVRAVAAAGGRFIISPNTDIEVIKATKAAGMISIPGCFTASEALAAAGAGADYLKLFPSGSIGAGYIKDLKAVVKLPFIAVGGVNRGNIREFLNCCAGVGIGGALYKAGKTLAELRRDVTALVGELGR